MATVAVALVVIAVAVGPHFVSGNPTPSTRPQLATASVRSFPVTIGATGTVVPAMQVALNFSSAGRLTEIDAKVGTAVKAGTVLARIDPTAAQSGVAAAQGVVAASQGSVTSAQGDVAAAEAPLKDGIPTTGQTPTAELLALAQAKLQSAQANLQSAQANLQSAQANLAAAQAALANTVLLASVGATIEQVNGQVGETVGGAATAAPTLPGTSAPIPAATDTGAASTQAQPFIVLGDPTHVVVGVAFSPSDAQKLAVGNTGTITEDTVSGLSLPCHVLAVATTATMVSGSPMVYASVVPDGSSQNLMVGAAVDVSVTLSRATNVLAVARSAVYSLSGVPHVDIWNGTRPVSTVVTTGLQGTELVQVTSGLKSGQQVLLSAYQGLSPKTYQGLPQTTNPTVTSP